MAHPTLYSLRNCPYAMRARLAIYKSKTQVILRDVVLSNKPEEMLIASPKGTVPILVLSKFTLDKGIEDNKSLVIEESLELMLWALSQNDPNDLLLGGINSKYDLLPDMVEFITIFDTEFKVCLENYKCAKRYHESNLEECRKACEVYIADLEHQLNRHSFLFDEQESLVDIALLPFMRQFARIERQWYLQSAYPKLREWLNRYLQSPMFTKVMAKYPLWLDERKDIFFCKLRKDKYLRKSQRFGLLRGSAAH